MPERYRRLDPDKIVQTAERLRDRIRERFPERGIGRVAEDVVQVAVDARLLAQRLGQPVWPLRVAAVALTASLLGALLLGLTQLRVSVKVESAWDLVQGTESLVNDAVFTGVAVWFVFSLEARRKRARALALISELRALAHVIDMHQLTKDPSPTTRGERGAQPTDRQLGAAELIRYLDYSSELLSLLGKLAALCISRFDDPNTLAAVNELEDLVNGLSRKLWQKIMIIEQVTPPHATPPGSPSAASESDATA